MPHAFEAELRATTDTYKRKAFRYRFPKDESAHLPVEERRALAVYRAIDLAEDVSGAKALVHFAGAERMLEEATYPTITRDECERLAGALRRAGYPLDDDGIRRFKLERGYSKAVRIGPDVAEAYAHHARGLETRMDIPPDIWRRMDLEARRATRVLMLIGRNPRRLIEVWANLELSDRPPVHNGMIPVCRASAKKLLRWAHGLGISFTNAGLDRLVRAAHLPSRTVDMALAQFIADSVTCKGEPRHDYTRMATETAHGRIILNRRTLQMLNEADERLEGAKLKILRGSYEPGTGRGAHPHQAGGTADLDVEPQTHEAAIRALIALRGVGFAAWYRPRREHPHLHAVAIGDRELAPAASWQVKSYFQGRDGRSRSDTDPHAALKVQPPTWTVKYSVPYV